MSELNNSEEKIVGFHGFAQSGKDESCKILKEVGYIRVALADPIREAIYKLNPIIAVDLKWGWEFLEKIPTKSVLDVGSDLVFIRVDELVDILGWDEAKRFSEVRRLLQVFGTEVGRELFGENVWIDVAERRISKEQLEKVAISDIRFQNEVEWLKSKNGKLIKIKRPNVTSVNSHISDKGIDDELCDIIINNDGTLEELKNKLI